MMSEPGWIVILKGAPRSGKSSIVTVIQETFAGPWMNLGVDAFNRGVTPPRYRPGIGLRPGGERPDLEAVIPAMYAALYDAVAAHGRQGLNVAVDVGHHDAYSTRLHTLRDAARKLDGLPVLFVGVHCPLAEIMRRRDDGQPGREGLYEVSAADGAIPEPITRWQEEVHIPGIYDLEVDTSVLTPAQCAAIILERLQGGPQRSAIRRLAPEG